MSLFLGVCMITDWNCFFLQKNDSPTDNFAWKDQIASLNGMLV